MTPEEAKQLRELQELLLSHSRNFVHGNGSVTVREMPNKDSMEVTYLQPVKDAPQNEAIVRMRKTLQSVNREEGFEHVQIKLRGKPGESLSLSVILKPGDLEEVTSIVGIANEMEREDQFLSTMHHKIYALLKDGVGISAIHNALKEARTIDIMGPAVGQIISQLKGNGDEKPLARKQAEQKLDNFKAEIVGHLASLCQQGMDVNNVHELASQLQQEVSRAERDHSASPQALMQYWRKEYDVTHTSRGGGNIER